MQQDYLNYRSIFERKNTLNLVCGWNQKSLRCLMQKKPNLKAYEQGQEWVKIFKSILANKKTSLNGNF